MFFIDASTLGHFIVKGIWIAKWQNVFHCDDVEGNQQFYFKVTKYLSNSGYIKLKASTIRPKLNFKFYSNHTFIRPLPSRTPLFIRPLPSRTPLL
jgi:hypothetical protein